MFMCMVRIKYHQYLLFIFRDLFYLVDNGGINRRALDQSDPFKHWMLFDLCPVMFTDINIHSYYLTFANQFQHRSIKYDRAPMSDAGFNDQVRLYFPDDFLHGQYILWVLNDRSAHPGEIIGVP